MAKQNSKKTPKQSPGVFKTAFSESFQKYREIIWNKKRARVRLHQSFKRSYREDYARKLNVPGLLHHAMDTFIFIFKNWKLFLPLIIFAVIFNIVLVGLMSEETYVKFQSTLDETNDSLAGGSVEVGNVTRAGLLLISTITTGGLTSGLSEVQIIFAVIIFLILWLVTIYLARRLLAGKKVRLRDGFYNALTPLLSTFVVFFVACLQTLPIFVLVIAYSAAVQTDFLSMPFYALIFFIFAGLLVTLTTYLLSSTLIALIAVSAPGLYPLAALRSASDLMASRRIRFVIRLFFLVFVIVVYWTIVMLPLIIIDLFLKAHISWLNGVPFIPICLQIMTCFTIIYLTNYLYLYYRRMLAHEDD